MAVLALAVLALAVLALAVLALAVLALAVLALVGLAGFEPAASATQTRRASQAALQPVYELSLAAAPDRPVRLPPAGCRSAPERPLWDVIHRRRQLLPTGARAPASPASPRIPSILTVITVSRQE